MSKEIVSKYVSVETYKDDNLTIVKKDNKLRYTFKNFDNIPKSRRIGTFLKYFGSEIEFMPKSAILDLLDMAFELVKGGKTTRDLKYFYRIKDYSRKDIINSFWNIILAEEGLGFIR